MLLAGMMTPHGSPNISPSRSRQRHFGRSRQPVLSQPAPTSQSAGAESATWASYELIRLLPLSLSEEISLIERSRILLFPTSIYIIWSRWIEQLLAGLPSDSDLARAEAVSSGATAGRQRDAANVNHGASANSMTEHRVSARGARQIMKQHGGVLTSPETSDEELLVEDPNDAAMQASGQDVYHQYRFASLYSAIELAARASQFYLWVWV